MTQAATGDCPNCGGKTVEVPYSRFSKCEDCGKDVLTAGWFPETDHDDVAEARARDARRRRPKPTKKPRKWEWASAAEREARRKKS